MTPRQLWGPVGIAGAVAMASTAWAWGDCMLLATSVVLAYRLFLLYMDRSAPWRALAATVTALSAAVITGFAGIALMAGIAASSLGWWQPAAEHPAAVLLMLCAGAAWCSLARRSRVETLVELQPWLWLFGGVVLAIEAQRNGLTLAPCYLVLGVGLVMLRAGWRLATVTASNLLRSGSESR